MTRINLFRTTAVRSTTFRSTPATLDSVAWGKINWGKNNFDKNASTLVFAALLIICSLAVGCSSEKPKPESSTNQSVMTTPPAVTPPSVPAPVLQAAAKPVRKKIVHKVTPTVAYADKTSGVSFQYPRKYSLKTGDAADQLVSSDPVPMDFVQPGGVAVAAVMLPESAYPKSDFAAAFFNVSVNKALTAEQCGEFSETKPAAPADPAAPAQTAAPAETAAPVTAQPAKLMIGDMELQSSETLASQGTGEEAAKYYHVFENGACYEFALKVTTTSIENQNGATHVDREKVFQRLEKILATVKITAPAEVTASAPPAATATTDAATPAQ
jgi:hypothetical protein